MTCLLHGFSFICAICLMLTLSNILFFVPSLNYLIKNEINFLLGFQSNFLFPIALWVFSAGIDLLNTNTCHHTTRIVIV